MLKRESWGLGLAREGAQTALAYGFGTLGLEYVISLIHPENARSIHLAERLGEHCTGNARVRGYDVLVYRLERTTVAA